MRSTLRNAPIFAIVGIVAAYAHMWASSWWFQLAVAGPGTVTTLEWLDIGHLKIWAFEIVWGMIVGAVIAATVVSNRPALWAIWGGVLSGLFHFSITSNYFFPTTPLNTYVWAYGVYLVPVVGSAIGGALVVFAKDRRNGQVHAV